jgi:hypothetical protein
MQNNTIPAPPETSAHDLAVGRLMFRLLPHLLSKFHEPYERLAKQPEEWRAWKKAETFVMADPGSMSEYKVKTAPTAAKKTPTVNNSVEYEELEASFDGPIMPSEPEYFIITPGETPRDCVLDPVIAWTVGTTGYPAPIGRVSRRVGNPAMLCPDGKVVGPMTIWSDGTVAGQSFSSIQEWLDYLRAQWNPAALGEDGP